MGQINWRFYIGVLFILGYIGILAFAKTSLADWTIDIENPQPSTIINCYKNGVPSPIYDTTNASCVGDYLTIQVDCKDNTACKRTTVVMTPGEDYGCVIGTDAGCAYNSSNMSAKFEYNKTSFTASGSTNVITVNNATSQRTIEVESIDLAGNRKKTTVNTTLSAPTLDVTLKVAKTNVGFANASTTVAVPATGGTVYFFWQVTGTASVEKCTGSWITSLTKDIGVPSGSASRSVTPGTYTVTCYAGAAVDQSSVIVTEEVNRYVCGAGVTGGGTCGSATVPSPSNGCSWVWDQKAPNTSNCSGATPYCYTCIPQTQCQGTCAASGGPADSNGGTPYPWSNGTCNTSSGESGWWNWDGVSTNPDGTSKYSADSGGQACTNAKPYCFTCKAAALPAPSPTPPPINFYSTGSGITDTSGPFLWGKMYSDGDDDKNFGVGDSVVSSVFNTKIEGNYPAGTVFLTLPSKVSCGGGGLTPNQLCQQAGYPRAVGNGYIAAKGYGWAQCGGATVESCNGINCTISRWDCTTPQSTVPNADTMPNMYQSLQNYYYPNNDWANIIPEEIAGYARGRIKTGFANTVFYADSSTDDYWGKCARGGNSGYTMRVACEPVGGFINSQTLPEVTGVVTPAGTGQSAVDYFSSTPNVLRGPLIYAFAHHKNSLGSEMEKKGYYTKKISFGTITPEVVSLVTPPTVPYKYTYYGANGTRFDVNIDNSGVPNVYIKTTVVFSGNTFVYRDVDLVNGIDPLQAPLCTTKSCQLKAAPRIEKTREYSPTMCTCSAYESSGESGYCTAWSQCQYKDAEGTEQKVTTAQGWTFFGLLGQNGNTGTFTVQGVRNLSGTDPARASFEIGPITDLPTGRIDDLFDTGAINPNDKLRSKSTCEFQSEGSGAGSFSCVFVPKNSTNIMPVGSYQLRFTAPAGSVNASIITRKQLSPGDTTNYVDDETLYTGGPTGTDPTGRMIFPFQIAERHKGMKLKVTVSTNNTSVTLQNLGVYPVGVYETSFNYPYGYVYTNACMSGMDVLNKPVEFPLLTKTRTTQAQSCQTDPTDSKGTTTVSTFEFVNADLLLGRNSRISGKVFIDSNRNKRKDASESWYSGATINALGSTPVIATSDSSGVYNAADLRAGVYTVTMSPVTQHIFTTASSFNITVPPTYLVANDCSVADTIGCFGIVPVHSISGSIYIDNKPQNGVKEGEEINATVNELSGTGSNLRVHQGPAGYTSNLTMNPDGSYVISGLVPGDYIIAYSINRPYFLTSPQTGFLSVKVGMGNCAGATDPQGRTIGSCNATTGNISNLNFGVNKYAPWFSTSGGSVHSQQDINTPGGPD